MISPNRTGGAYTRKVRPQGPVWTADGLVAGPTKAPSLPPWLTLCEECGTAGEEKPCAKCGEDAPKIKLTEVEVHDFRRLTCANCAAEFLGFAKRCTHCKHPRK